MSPDELDARRDSLALVEACHRGDVEGARVLLANGDLRTMTTFLATVVDDLVGDLAEWWQARPDDMLARLRDHHVGAG